MPDQNSQLFSARREAQFRILRAIHSNPSLSQSELSKQLGMSLGKINYCVQALLNKGWITSNNHKNSKNRNSNIYHLTPIGIEQEIKSMRDFLERKKRENHLLRREIIELELEIPDSDEDY